MVTRIWCEECQRYTYRIVTDYGPLHFENCWDCGEAYGVDAEELDIQTAKV